MLGRILIGQLSPYSNHSDHLKDQLLNDEVVVLSLYFTGMTFVIF